MADRPGPLPIIAAPRRVAAALAAAAVLVACGTAPQSSASSTTAPGEATTAPPAATVAPASSPPASEPGVVQSRQYPYALRLPEGAEFLPAARAWSGRAAVMRGERTLDEVDLPNVVMFIVGTAWPGDLQSFAQMFVDLQARAFGCSQMKDRREMTVAATPAVAFIQDSCGGSPGEEFARLALVHNGFGLIAFTDASPGAVDRIVSGLAGLEWR